MKHYLKLDQNSFGFGYLSNQNKDRSFQIDISFEGNMLIAERFVSSLINTYDWYLVSTGGGIWYPQDYKFLKLKHHLHCPSEKSIIERTIQFINDSAECFDD